MLPTGEAMTLVECKRVLRRLELEAYCSIVSAFRAQGELSTAKKEFLQNIQEVLSISTERHKAEVRRAVSDETLTNICETLNGSSASLEWSIEGRRVVPLMPRSVPQTAYLQIADKAAREAQALNKAARLAEEQRKKKALLTDTSIPPMDEPPPSKRVVGEHIVLPVGTKLPEKSVMDHPDPDEPFKSKDPVPSTKNLPFVTIALSKPNKKSAPPKATQTTSDRPPSSKAEHKSSSKASSKERPHSEPDKKSRKLSGGDSHRNTGNGQKGPHPPPATSSAPSTPDHPHTYLAPPGGKHGSAVTTPPPVTPPAQPSKPHFLHTALTGGQEPGGVRYYGPPGKDPYLPPQHQMAWREPPKKHTPGIVRKSSKSKHHKHHSSKHGHGVPPTAGSLPTHPTGGTAQPLGIPKGTQQLAPGDLAKRPPSDKDGHRDKANVKIKSPSVPAVSVAKVIPTTPVGPGSIYKVTTVGATPVQSRPTTISSGVSPPQYYTTVSSQLAMASKYSSIFSNPKVPPSSSAQIVKLTAKNVQQRAAVMQKGGIPGKGNVIVVQKSPANPKTPPIIRPEAMQTSGSVMARPKIVMTTTSGGITSPHPGPGSIRYASPTTQAQSPVMMSPGGRIRQIIRTTIPSTTPSPSGDTQKSTPTGYLSREAVEMKEFKPTPGQPLPSGPTGQRLPAGTKLGPSGGKWAMVSSGYVPIGQTGVGPRGPLPAGYQPGGQKVPTGTTGHHIVIPAGHKGPLPSGYPVGAPHGQKLTSASPGYQQGQRVFTGKKPQPGPGPQSAVLTGHLAGQSLPRDSQPMKGLASSGPKGIAGTTGQMAGPPNVMKGSTPPGGHAALTAKLLKATASFNPTARTVTVQSMTKGAEQGNPSLVSPTSGIAKPMMFATVSKDQTSAVGTTSGLEAQFSTQVLATKQSPSEQSAESAARALLDIHNQATLQSELTRTMKPSENTPAITMVTAKSQSAALKSKTLQVLSQSLKRSTKADPSLVTVEDQGVVSKRINLTPSDVSEFVDQFEEFLEREGLSEQASDTKGRKGDASKPTFLGKGRTASGIGTIKASSVIRPPTGVMVTNISGKPIVTVSQGVSRQVVGGMIEKTGVKQIQVMPVVTPKMTVGSSVHALLTGKGTLPRTVYQPTTAPSSASVLQPSNRDQVMRNVESKERSWESPGAAPKQPQHISAAAVKSPGGTQISMQPLPSVVKATAGPQMTPQGIQAQPTVPKSAVSVVTPVHANIKTQAQAKSEVAKGPVRSQTPDLSKVPDPAIIPKQTKGSDPAKGIDLSKGPDPVKDSDVSELSKSTDLTALAKCSDQMKADHPKSLDPLTHSDLSKGSDSLRRSTTSQLKSSDPSTGLIQSKTSDPKEILGTIKDSDMAKDSGSLKSSDPPKDFEQMKDNVPPKHSEQSMHSGPTKGLDQSKAVDSPARSDQSRLSDPSKATDPSGAVHAPKESDPYQWEEAAGGNQDMSDLIKAISQPKVSLVKMKQQGMSILAEDNEKQAQSAATSPQKSSTGTAVESGSTPDVSHKNIENVSSQGSKELDETTLEPEKGRAVEVQAVEGGGKRMPKDDVADLPVVSGSDSSISDASGSETHHLRASKRKRKAPTPIDEETGPSSMPSWARAAWNMLLRVMRFRGANRAKGDINAASWFNRPVDPKESPSYFKIIKVPMDFSTVKRNLENGVYQGFPDFHQDMIMVRRNCLKFNPPGHKARKDCDEVFQFYQEEYNKAMERWGKAQSTPKSPKRMRPDPAPK